MTGNIFVDCLFLFLICYAILSIFYNLSDFLLKHYCKYPQRTFLTIEIKHESKVIERDIRCAISKSLKEKCCLVIICNGFTEAEHTLAKSISACYDNVILTTPDDFKKITETASSISVSL